jgi:hypothetical protein
MFDMMQAVAVAALIVATILGVVAFVIYRDRKSLLRELKDEKLASLAISNRLEVVKGDNRELQRENGRLKAEKLLAQPKRDPVTGRFIPRAQA